MLNNEFDFSDKSAQPLAARMRPKTLEQYIGQSHLLAPNKPLYQAIKKGHLHSMLLWGAPGVGKTTLAEIIAHFANAEIERLSAVTSGVKEIRSAIDKAELNRQRGVKTILFVDEVHRFNKSQQDAFLPFIENGTITFIGATTENPSFELNSALLSRMNVYLLKSLTIQEVEKVIDQAMQDKIDGFGTRETELTPETKRFIAEFVNGDARRALNILEQLVESNPNESILTLELLKEIIGEKTARFDKQGDRYYDLISALHKSIRGSAPDASLYWFARIITAGGDPLYVARRLLAIASEDVGNADPRAMQVALAAWDCFTRVGAAEGERAIAQAIVYLACAPKSNAIYLAFNQAVHEAKTLPDYDVPVHLRNAPTQLMRDMKVGKNYRYAHHEPNAYAAGECYFPPEMQDHVYYRPSDRGAEKQYQEKLKWLKKLDEESESS